MKKDNGDASGWTLLYIFKFNTGVKRYSFSRVIFPVFSLVRIW